jgi:hypothetical protein
MLNLLKKNSAHRPSALPALLALQLRPLSEVDAAIGVMDLSTVEEAIESVQMVIEGNHRRLMSFHGRQSLSQLRQQEQSCEIMKQSQFLAGKVLPRLYRRKAAVEVDPKARGNG